MLLPIICRVSTAITRQSQLQLLRCLSTLPNNPHIYIFSALNSHVLSFLPKDPPVLSLSIGNTSRIPPTPDSFRENPTFLTILHNVLAQHAASDPQLQGQAAAFATSSGFLPSYFSGLSSSKRNKGFRSEEITKKLESTLSQSKDGGMEVESSGRGGWVHVSDHRAPPAYGRIAWPEDILGSLEVDDRGRFVDGGDGKPLGRYEPSGTYRIVTANGVLKLSDFLREKLVEKLNELDQQGNTNNQAS